MWQAKVKKRLKKYLCLNGNNNNKMEIEKRFDSIRVWQSSGWMRITHRTLRNVLKSESDSPFMWHAIFSVYRQQQLYREKQREIFLPSIKINTYTFDWSRKLNLCTKIYLHFYWISHLQSNSASVFSPHYDLHNYKCSYFIELIVFLNFEIFIQLTVFAIDLT